MRTLTKITTIALAIIYIITSSTAEESLDAAAKASEVSIFLQEGAEISGKRYTFLEHEDTIRELSSVPKFQVRFLEYCFKKEKTKEFKDNIIEIIKIYKGDRRILFNILKELDGEEYHIKQIKRAIFKKLLHEKFFLNEEVLAKILLQPQEDKDLLLIATQGLIAEKLNIAKMAAAKMSNQEKSKEVKMNINFLQLIKKYKGVTPEMTQRYVHQTEYIDLMICQKNKKNKSLIFKILNERSEFNAMPLEWLNIKLLAINYLMDFSHDRRYVMAYHLLEKTIKNIPSDKKSELQFKLGYFALKIKEYDLAISHLLNYYHESAIAAEKSRAAYWLSIAYRDLEPSTANKYKEIASSYYLTFYGQLAMKDLGEKTLAAVIKNKVTKDTKLLNERELGLQNNLLFAVGKEIEGIDENTAIEFFEAFLKESHIPENTKYLGLSKLYNKPFYNRVCKYAVMFNVIRIDSKVFPIHSEIMDSPSAHAIIKQESGFVKNARSNKNARGIMQIIPSTAKIISKRLGLKYRQDQLYNEKYNILLGTQYLKDLGNMFDQNQVLVLAAYNAGPIVVKKWIEKYGNFSKLNTNEERAEWIENIPFKETRMYIKKITPDEVIYEILLDIKKLENSHSL